jgi:hypothetical protein
MSNELSGGKTFRGVCGAEECVEDTGGLGYDAAKSKNVAASGNGGVVKSTLFARLVGGAAGMGGGGCAGGCDAPRLGPNVRK